MKPIRTKNRTVKIVVLSATAKGKAEMYIFHQRSLLPNTVTFKELHSQELKALGLKRKSCILVTEEVVEGGVRFRITYPLSPRSPAPESLDWKGDVSVPRDRYQALQEYLQKRWRAEALAGSRLIYNWLENPVVVTIADEPFPGAA